MFYIVTIRFYDTDSMTLHYTVYLIPVIGNSIRTGCTIDNKGFSTMFGFKNSNNEYQLQVNRV